jgi:GntR family transcriptional regulator
VATRNSPTSGKRSFFNPFPKYLQVRQVLERRLAGEYEIGQQIPTEEALCKEFGVSRETVREAVHGLESDGIVQRRRPRGTFLIRRPDQAATHKVTGLVEDLAALHLDTHARVLSATLVRPPPEARSVDREAVEVFRIERLRYLDAQPLVLHEAYLPAALGAAVCKLDLEHAAISQLLERELGIRVVEEGQQIEAMVADSELARRLDIAIGSPVLLIRRMLRLPRDGTQVLFKSFYRADRYFYTLNLAPAAPSSVPAAVMKKRQTRNP